MQRAGPAPMPSLPTTTVSVVGITSDERIAVEALLALSSTQQTPRAEWNPFAPVDHIRNQPTSAPDKPAVYTPKMQRPNLGSMSAITSDVDVDSYILIA